MKEETTLPNEMSEVSLRLEEYGDIFSDFDMRPYSKRALSVDFIDEIKRAVNDRDVGEVEMILHLPEKERKEYEEVIIKERLGAHFKRHFHLLQGEKRRVMNFGTTMVVVGIVFMSIATYIRFHDPSHSMFLSFLLVFLEPSAWFLLWEGMDQILFTSKDLNPNLNFYRKMSNAHQRIHFKSF